MSVVVQTTNLIATGVQVTLANGETFDEVAGVSIISTNAANAIVSTTASATETVEVNGQIIGGDDAIFDSQTGAFTTLNVGVSGLVQGATGVGVALAGISAVYNNGQISGIDDALSLGDALVRNNGEITASGVDSNGVLITFGGALYNFGSISAPTAVALGVNSASSYIYNAGTFSSAFGIVDDSNNTLNATTVVNTGTISGNNTSFQSNGTAPLSLNNSGKMFGALITNSTSAATVVNSGLIVGDVNLRATSTFNNSGSLQGALTAANGSTITDSGTITGAVSLSSGTINLYDTQISINGSGDTVNLVTGPSDVVNLSGNAAWNNILGSNATINLSNALTGVVGGFDTINFATSTTDTVSLWNTQANWDNIFGSNGTAYLNHAITGVVGGGNTVYFNTGTDNIASLWNTNGAWDNVYGSNNTVYLSDAISGVVGGGDVIDFFYGTGNAASLWNTGGAADTVNNNAGVSGTLYINNAQANVTGSGDTIAFTYAGANSVTVSGNNETFIAQGLSGTDSITGYNATDQVYLSASQFGSSWSTFMTNDVVQSGSNTLITDPSNHANLLTLVGVTPSSLSQANFHFV